MKRYVLAFILTPDLLAVWLIRKNKPEWQQGCLNGLGGKIEDGESPRQAMVRELKEESGLDIPEDQLTEIGIMKGTNNDGSEFEVYIFTSMTNEQLVSREEEVIDVYEVWEIKDHKHIENVPMLIETCIYRLSGHSFFHKITMEYNQKMRTV